MKFNLIKNITESSSRVGAKALLKLKKASPELLIVGGVACVIGGTIMACKATKRATEVLEEHNEQLDDIQDMIEQSEVADPDNEAADGVNYPVSAQRKDKIAVYAKTAGKLAQAYAPAVAVGGLGIAMIFASHGIMRKRNATILAAYNAVDTAFRKYRARVIEEYGEEKDREFQLGARKKKVNYIETDENGNGRQVKTNGYVFSEAASPYVFNFNQYTSYRWSGYPLSNLNTLRSAESWACDQLRIQGHLFLNEVLDYLGMDRTPVGALAGWIYDTSEDHNGDNFVDFGLCEGFMDDAMACDQDVLKKSIRLNFNCEGEIWEKIG